MQGGLHAFGTPRTWSGRVIAMKLVAAPKMVMANHPGLKEHLHRELAWEFERGPVDLRYVRNFVSSPRLGSHSVRAFSHPGLSAVGDTYLDERTMLADAVQKTLAISLADYHLVSPTLEVVDEHSPTDASVIKLQIWPFNPQELDDFAFAVAVALSYTPAELMAESRISLALDGLVSRWGFYTDEF